MTRAGPMMKLDGAPARGRGIDLNLAAPPPCGVVGGADRSGPGWPGAGYEWS
jgi:hypothetical protein